MTLFLFGISMGEIVLIFLVVLMLFGAKNLPELARGLGKGLNSFRRATEEIKQELSEEVSHLREDAEEVLRDEAPREVLDDASVNALYGLDRESDRKSTRLNSSHVRISYAVFCLKKKKQNKDSD